jgi:hypothetical protein
MRTRERPPIYDHIVLGGAGDARPLLARIALHFGGFAREFPVQLCELGKIAECEHDPSADYLNEMLVLDLVRECLIFGHCEWDDYEEQQLRSIAARAPSAAILRLVRSAQGGS